MQSALKITIYLQAQLGVDYVPTEEEKGVLRECNQESFFYRCKFPPLRSITLSHKNIIEIYFS